MPKKQQHILQIGDPVLREKAVDVKPHLIQSARIQAFIAKMINTLHANEGVGLAAPQIGKLLRIIIVDNSGGKSRRKKNSEYFARHILINPRITQTSKKIEADWEGCLSIDNGDLLGMVPRYTQVTVTALDEKGKEITIQATEFQARVLQHEIDHLDGILFFDRMRKQDMKTLTTRYYWDKYYNK